jgi:hypothetical protein
MGANMIEETTRMITTTTRPTGHEAVFNALAGRPGSNPLTSHSLPPEPLGLPEVDRPIARLRELEGEHRAARTEFRRLDAGRRKVAEADRAALADAVRAGTKPPANAELEHAARTASAKRRAEALDVACMKQAAEVAALLQVHKATLLARATADEAEAGDREREALAELRAAAVARTEAARRLSWARSVDAGRPRYSKSARRSALDPMPGAGEGTMLLEQLLDHLERST